MQTSRRAFLAALTVAPVAAALAKPRWFHLRSGWYTKPLPVPDNAIVFHGSFRIGEITRRARMGRIRAAYDRMWGHQTGLLEQRVEETVRNLGGWIDQEYTRARHT